MVIPAPFLSFTPALNYHVVLKSIVQMKILLQRTYSAHFTLSVLMQPIKVPALQGPFLIAIN